MKAEVAKLIKEAADECGFDDIEIRDDYSGRGMYGESTVAIVYGEHQTLIKSIALAAIRCHEQYSEFENRADDETPESEEPISPDEFVDNLPYKLDNMGRSSMVTY